MGWVVFFRAEAIRHRLRGSTRRLVAAQDHAGTWPDPGATAAHRRCLHAATNELCTDIEAVALPPVPHTLRLAK